jgi:hypothetical protein
VTVSTVTTACSCRSSTTTGECCSFQGELVLQPRLQQEHIAAVLATKWLATKRENEAPSSDLRHLRGVVLRLS